MHALTPVAFEPAPGPARPGPRAAAATPRPRLHRRDRGSRGRPLPVIAAIHIGDRRRRHAQRVRGPKIRPGQSASPGPSERAMASTGNEDSRSLRTRLDFTDAELLAECEVHTYRASGPGGQKRNKTSSAVRLHHQPSGLRAPAEESRSQHENKARALRRLRETIAVSCRLDPPTSKALPPELVSPDLVLRVSAKNPQRGKHTRASA